MIFDSLGIGEIGVIAVVAILFIDPKKVGAAGRAFARLRKKWNAIQREVKDQFNTLSLEEDLKENLGGIRSAKAALRSEARDALKKLPSVERTVAAEKILARLKEWPAFQNSKVVAAFVGSHDEVETENILRHVLASGKTLLLPYIGSSADGNSRMFMAPIRNYDQDLHEGAFGILEPKEELRGMNVGASTRDTPTIETTNVVGASLVVAPTPPEPDLILIPGLAFDERGGRVGRGRGFYDRFLDGKNAFKLGMAFETQILRKKLALEPHDKLLDGLITEERLLAFSMPSSPSSQSPTG